MKLIGENEIQMKADTGEMWFKSYKGHCTNLKFEKSKIEKGKEEMGNTINSRVLGVCN